MIYGKYTGQQRGAIEGLQIENTNTSITVKTGLICDLNSTQVEQFSDSLVNQSNYLNDNFKNLGKWQQVNPAQNGWVVSKVLTNGNIIVCYNIASTPSQLAFSMYDRYGNCLIQRQLVVNDAINRATPSIFQLPSGAFGIAYQNLTTGIANFTTYNSAGVVQNTYVVTGAVNTSKWTHAHELLSGGAPTGSFALVWTEGTVEYYAVITSTNTYTKSKTSLANNSSTDFPARVKGLAGGGFAILFLDYPSSIWTAYCSTFDASGNVVVNKMSSFVGTGGSAPYISSINQLNNGNLVFTCNRDNGAGTQGYYFSIFTLAGASVVSATALSTPGTYFTTSHSCWITIFASGNFTIIYPISSTILNLKLFAQDGTLLKTLTFHNGYYMSSYENFPSILTPDNVMVAVIADNNIAQTQMIMLQESDILNTFPNSIQTGTTTINSTSVTNLTSTAALVIGMNISGTNIPINTTITSIVSSTAITISNNATASGTILLTFATLNYQWRAIAAKESDGSITTLALDDLSLNQPVNKDFWLKKNFQNTQISTWTATYTSTQSRILQNGNIVFVFSDTVSGNYGNFIIFDPYGNVVKAKTQYNTVNATQMVGMDVLSNGNFVIIWRHSSNGYSYFAIYDQAGALVKAPTQWNGTDNTYHPKVVGLSTGNFMIVYLDYTLGTTYTYIKIYSNDGNTVIKVATQFSTTAVTEAYIDACKLTNGNIAVIWSEAGTNQYFMIFDATGTVVRAKTLITVVGATSSQSTNRIRSMSNGNFVCTFRYDYLSKVRCMFAIYDINGNTLKLPTEVFVGSAGNGSEYGIGLGITSDNNIHIVNNFPTSGLYYSLWDSNGNNIFPATLLVADTTGVVEQPDIVVTNDNNLFLFFTDLAAIGGSFIKIPNNHGRNYCPANNQLNMYSLYDNSKGYCRDKIWNDGTNSYYRIIGVFKWINKFIDSATTSTSYSLLVADSSKYSIGMKISSSIGIPVNSEVVEIIDSTHIRINEPTPSSISTMIIVSNDIQQIIPIEKKPKTNIFITDHIARTVATTTIVPIIFSSVELDLLSEVIFRPERFVFMKRQSGKWKIKYFNAEYVVASYNGYDYIFKNNTQYQCSAMQGIIGVQCFIVDINMKNNDYLYLNNQVSSASQKFNNNGSRIRGLTLTIEE